MKFDNLGDRMKDYENVSRISLTKRQPIIIRLDGRAFHSFTRGFKKPFDTIMQTCMQETCTYLCENIMNCKLAYTQSDEISLLLIDYENQNSQQWFDNNLQKMASVSASMATVIFNKVFAEQFVNLCLDMSKNEENLNANEYLSTLERRLHTATFDSRAFILPKEEVCNYFIWRQQDATRNSIFSVAHSVFSHKQLHGLNGNQLQEKLHAEKDINWNDFSTVEKRGCCVIKKNYVTNGSIRKKWTIDKDIPIFTVDRDYVDNFVFMERSSNE